VVPSLVQPSVCFLPQSQPVASAGKAPISQQFTPQGRPQPRI